MILMLKISKIVFFSTKNRNTVYTKDQYVTQAIMQAIYGQGIRVFDLPYLLI